MKAKDKAELNKAATKTINQEKERIMTASEKIKRDQDAILLGLAMAENADLQGHHNIALAIRTALRKSGLKIVAMSKKEIENQG